MSHPSPAAPAASFEAVLYPNPALGRTAFLLLALLVAAASTLFGLGFAAVGAWPVSGFLGLDALLLILACQVGRRRSRRTEWIRLDREGLHVRRQDAAGRRHEWRFEPAWVRVLIDEPPRTGSALTLSAAGRRLSIGGFLTPEERLDLARSLRQALGAYK